VAATLEAVAGQIGGRGGEGVAIGCGGVQSTPAAARVALEAATRGCGVLPCFCHGWGSRRRGAVGRWCCGARMTMTGREEERGEFDMKWKILLVCWFLHSLNS